MIHDCGNNTGWRRFESPENVVDGELAAGEAGGSCQTRLLITPLIGELLNATYLSQCRLSTTRRVTTVHLVPDAMEWLISFRVDQVNRLPKDSLGLLPVEEDRGREVEQVRKVVLMVI